MATRAQYTLNKGTHTTRVERSPRKLRKPEPCLGAVAMAISRRASRHAKLFLLVLLGCLALYTALLRLRKHTKREVNQKNEDMPDFASLKEIAGIAQSISRLGKPVLLNVFNNGFLQMTLNWLCHTQPMNIHQHVLLVTLDSNTTKAIKAEGYKVRVVTYLEEGGARVEGDQNYGQLGYHRLLATRAKVLNATLQGGVEVIQFESDATWMVSPFRLTLTFATANGTDLDLVYLSAWERPTEVATGFLFLRPRPPVLALVHKVAATLDQALEKRRQGKDRDEADVKLYDQPLVSKLYADLGVKGQSVPYHIAPDGMWYSRPLQYRAKSRPVMISNNFVIGNEAKMKRARHFGHWFLDSQSHCNSSQAQAFVAENLKTCGQYCP